MNKKEKEILEKRVLESELECLEAAHICQMLLPGTNIFKIKMDAMENFKLTKGM